MYKKNKKFDSYLCKCIDCRVNIIRIRLADGEYHSFNTSFEQFGSFDIESRGYIYRWGYEKHKCTHVNKRQGDNTMVLVIDDESEKKKENQINAEKAVDVTEEAPDKDVKQGESQLPEGTDESNSPSIPQGGDRNHPLGLSSLASSENQNETTEPPRAV